MAKPSDVSKNIAPSLITFDWVGVDKRGTTMKGEILSKSEGLARAELRKQGIEAVKKITVKKNRKKGGKKITGRDIAMTSRQLATMMKSGVPLVQAMDIMASGQENPRLGKLLADIRDDLSSGLSLYECLNKHPLYFDDLYRNLVRAGEGAGVLDVILDTIATYKEKTETLKGKIKKALFYPIGVIAVAIIVSAILLLYVVPQFESLFKGFGADLPAFTQMIVNASKLLQSYWWILLGIGAGSFVGLRALFKRSAAFRNGLDRMMLRLPVIGKILNGSAIARFARTLAITFRAGVPLVEALETVAGATGSETYRKAVMRIRDDVSVGYTVNTAMRQVGLFPHIVVQMTAIGEEAGSLDTMLTKLAEFYEEEVNNAVDSLSSLLEPFIMVILGTLVGGMVIGMYLPIFKMGEAIG
jgi:type IV pilus assembly protein PilC